MIHRVALPFVLAASLAMVACDAQTAPEGSPNTPTMQSSASSPSVELLAPKAFVDALAQAEDAYLIDCRTPGEVAGGTLPGAINLDYNAPDFRERVAALDREHAVFVYCQAGGRSARSAAVLRELGFARVVDLEGGYGAYLQSGASPE